jgi:hypothetical protein
VAASPTTCEYLSAGEGAGGSESNHVRVPESADECTGGREGRHVLVPESAGKGAGGSEAGSVHCESQLAACVGNPGLTVVQNYLESVSAKDKEICHTIIRTCSSRTLLHLKKRKSSNSSKNRTRIPLHCIF